MSLKLIDYRNYRYGLLLLFKFENQFMNCLNDTAFIILILTFITEMLTFIKNIFDFVLFLIESKEQKLSKRTNKIVKENVEKCINEFELKPKSWNNRKFKKRKYARTKNRRK